MPQRTAFVNRENPRRALPDAGDEKAGAASLPPLLLYVVCFCGLFLPPPEGEAPRSAAIAFPDEAVGGYVPQTAHEIRLVR